MVLIDFSEFIGRFHPVLVHLPIGFLLIGIFLQWLSGKDKSQVSPKVVLLVMIMGTTAALFACITGYLLSLTGEYEQDLTSLHMWMGIAVFVVGAIYCFFISAELRKWSSAILSFILIVLITITGHLGGTITHGQGYLTNAFNDEDTVVVRKVIPDINEAMVYNDIVQPILQKDCYNCHGSKKQKGQLRLDDMSLILKGGEDGPVLVPGNAEESELVRRLLLPKNHEDHMPPKSKRQLSEHEISVINWWIVEGAHFDKKVKDLKVDPKLNEYLTGLQTSSGELANTSNPIIPSEPVEMAPDSILHKLKNMGVVVIPVAPNSNYLMANFVTAKISSQEDVHVLTGISKQLLNLKLNLTEIGDEALSYVGQCNNLSVLQLNNTSVTDKGLLYLKNLKNLQSLSLVGTSVTDHGLEHLKSLKNLKTVYLYQTKVDRNNWTEIQTRFPGVFLDSGGYHLPSTK